MAEVLLFHHAQGLTPGVVAFADQLRAAGHVVHTPDLYEGKRFDQIENGVAYAQLIGFDTILERGQMAAEDLPKDLVYAGFSLGGMPAQMLAQTRPGARGALLFHSAIPPSEFGTGWPKGVPLQIHMMEADPFAQEGDLDAARELAKNPRRSRAVPVPRRPPPVRRQQPGRLRRRGHHAAHRTRAGLPRRPRVAPFGPAGAGYTTGAKQGLPVAARRVRRGLTLRGSE